MNRHQEPKKQKKNATKKTKQAPQKQSDGVKKVRNMNMQGSNGERHLKPESKAAQRISSRNK